MLDDQQTEDFLWCLQKRLAGNREARDGNLEQAIALFTEVVTRCLARPIKGQIRTYRWLLMSHCW